MQKTASFYKLVSTYAHAFFNTFANHITTEQYNNIQKAGNSLTKNHTLISLLQISSLHHRELKKKCVLQIIDQFYLPQDLYKLGLILISNNRIHLFPFILKKITLLHEQKINSMTMQISCSHNLPEQNRKKIVLLLHSLTKSNIRPIFLIDTSLIAGIRAQSKTVLWEKSIKKMLKSIKAQVKK